MDCCDPNGLNGVFRGAYVKREARAFLRHGLSVRQESFFKGLTLEGKSVLDVGCGVGALGLTALQRGAVSATLIDVSADYLMASRRNAAVLDLARQTAIAQADFAHWEDAPRADLVLLDRVVCCYPNAVALLSQAARSSRKALLFTYPQTAWWLRLGRNLLNGALRLIGKRYRFYLHDEADLCRAASQYGHRLIRRERLGLWTLMAFSSE